MSTVDANEVETKVEKVKDFFKRYSGFLGISALSLYMYCVGRKHGYISGYKNGQNRGFGIGSAAACDIILNVRPETREDFLKAVKEAWNMK